jgi:uncharacterized protein (UPF0261 family)
VRITREEAARIGAVFAERVNAAAGPAAVVLPLRGCSTYELADGPFVDPEADHTLFEAIRSALRPEVEVREVDANLNDAAAADAVAAAFLSRWRNR